jgi:hypothetical protein
MLRRVRPPTTATAQGRVIAIAVAAGLVALSFGGGGYGPQARAVASIVSWWIVAVGALAGVLPLAPIARAGRWLLVLLAAFALLTGISLAWADDAGAGFQGVSLALLYLGLATLTLLTLTRQTASAWLRGAGAGLAAVAAVALASRFLPGTLPDPVAALLPAARARLSYPIGYWNALGLAAASAMIVLAWCACAGTTRAGRSAALAVIPIPALTLYLTSSRGAVGALLAGLVLLLALERRRLALTLNLALAAAGALATIAIAAPRSAFVDGATGATARSQGHGVLAALLAACAAIAIVRHHSDELLRRAASWRAGRRLAWSGIAIVLAIAIAAATALHPGARLRAFERPPVAPSASGGVVASHLLDAGGSGRYQFWTAAWHAFERHPIDGLGAGGYEAWWTQHGSLPYHVRNAHSLPLETLAELGVPGGLILLGVIAVTGLATLRRRRVAAMPDVLPVAAAVAGCGAISAAVDWMWQVPAVLAPALIAAAILTGLPAADRAHGIRRARRAALPVAGATIAIAVAVAAIVLVTDVELQRSRAAVRAGDFVQAAGDASGAAAIQPWAAAPRLQLALVEERRGNLPAAMRSASQALARAPSDWQIWLVAARLRTKAGDVAGARRALAQLRCLNPNGAFLPVATLGSRRSAATREPECDQRTGEARRARPLTGGAR